MKQNPFDDIPAKRRELYFRIINGERDFHPITLRLHFLNERFPINKLDAALTWLVKNNVVGQQFIKWFRLQCNNSDLQMHANLLRIINNAQVNQIVAGKNFRA